MIRLRAKQAEGLAKVLGEHPGQELALDSLGTPGEYGPLLVTIAEDGVLVEETGAIDTDPEGVLL